MQLPSYTTKHTQNGYTLLFAVITATLVLGVAVFILSVSKKQYELSVAARESLYSLYAADSGIECAMVSANANSLATSSAVSILCNGNPVTSTNWTPLDSNDLKFNGMGFDGASEAYYTSPIYIKFNSGTCAKLVIFSGIYLYTDNSKGRRVIVDSSGYNNCDTNGAPVISSRTVERALRLGLSY